MSSDDSQRRLLEQAVAEHRAGRLADAHRLYLEVLHASPDHPDALNLLGVVLHQQGRHREAIDCLRRAVEITPTRADFHNNLGEAFRAIDRFRPAEKHFREAIALQPIYPAALNNLGLVLSTSGRLDEAQHCFDQAIAQDDSFAEAYLNAGSLAHRQGRFDAAEHLYRRAAQLAPMLAEPWNNLGLLERLQGRYDESIAYLHRAVHLSPDSPDLWSNLGNSLRFCERLEEAEQSYRKAVAFDPDRVEPAVNLAKLLDQQARTPEADAALATVQIRRPADDWLRLRRAVLCPMVFDDVGRIAEYRESLDRTLEELIDRPPRLDLESIDSLGCEPPFRLFFHGLDDLPLRRKFARLFAHYFPPREPAGRRGPPALGIVVTEPHDAIFAKSLGPILNGMSADFPSTTIVSSPASVERLKTKLSHPSVRFLAVPQRFDQFAEAIASARFDVLFHWEVGTDSTNYFLAFLRLAPVQCTSWGLQESTGVGTVDVYISSSLAEPTDPQRHYSERLNALPTLLSMETPLSRPARPRNRASFGLPEGGGVYLCPQNLGKLHPEFDLQLQGVLERDDAGIVVCLSRRTPAAAVQLRRRFDRTLGRHSHRVVFLDEQRGDDYASLYPLADVVLDTRHFSGANTTFDALSFATPVVAWPGEFHRGRYTSACLRALGMEDCIVGSVDQYAELAVRLAKDPEHRRDVSTRLQAAQPRLFGDRAVVAAWEHVLRDLLAQARPSA